MGELVGPLVILAQTHVRTILNPNPNPQAELWECD